MLDALIRLICGKPSPYATACGEKALAQLDYRIAKERGDTRAQNAAMRRLRNANHQMLRAEREGWA